MELCKQLSQGDVYTSIYALCRKTSEELTQVAAESSSKVKIVENIEVTNNEVTTAIQTAFQTTLSSRIPIHLLVHNAGAYGPPEPDLTGPAMYASQTLQTVTAERMRFAFELNTLAPLMITQALLPNLEEAAGESKVVIISSAMGSIEENTSGGHYGYRAAKAAVNMAGKSLAVDLKEMNIAVSLGKYNCAVGC